MNADSATRTQNTNTLTVTVEYRFHPLFGRELTVLRSPRGVDGAFEVVGLDGVALKVPRWMTLPEARCMQLSSEATVSVDALLALAFLLEAVNVPARMGKPMKRRNNEAGSTRAQHVDATAGSASITDAQYSVGHLDGSGDQRGDERRGR